jgi:hypothetical protein
LNKHRYRKLIEEMENNILKKKDPFPKTVADICHYLAGWKNKYNNKPAHHADANDGIAFATSDVSQKEGKGKAKK